MKKYSFIPASLLLLSILIGGCEKYLDINANPNAAAVPPIEGLLANTTNATANNTYYVSDWVSYYSQYLASPSVSSSTDTYQQVDASGTWTNIYGTLTDLYDMRHFAEEKGFDNYMAVADILTAYNLSMASNLWGDMPYSESFIGVKNLVPKFDTQEGLYDTCLNLLDRAVAGLQKPAMVDLNEGSDFVHGGSNDAWILTAYALKARLLNEVSKTAQYDPAKVLAAIDKAYTKNGDDAQVTQFTVRNPWADAAIANAGLNLDAWMSSYFVNATNGNTYGVFDPRLPQITEPTMFNDYRGTPNGAGYQGTRNTDHAQCYVDVDKWYSSTNSPIQLITNAECRFIEAEAAFRANNKSRAYSAYIAGIKASMTKLDLPADSINKYVDNAAVSVGEANLTLKLIMKEKYVACFLMPVTWDDLRRFDYAYKNFALPKNVTLTTFVRRMDYPSSEISRNGGNVPDVLRTDNLWWDK